MNCNRLSQEELNKLCFLYMEGQLSKNEENCLYEVLNNKEKLEALPESVLHVMRAEKQAFKKKGFKSRHKWILSGAAAAILVLVAVVLPVFGDTSSSDSSDSFVVWQDGKKITGEEAKKMAEESQQIDMEMIRQIMRQQREMMKQNYASVNIDDYDF